MSDSEEGRLLGDGGCSDGDATPDSIGAGGAASSDHGSGGDTGGTGGGLPAVEAVLAPAGLPVDPHEAALGMLRSAGLPCEHAAEALERTRQEGGDSGWADPSAWADAAQVWLAIRQEDEAEVAKLRDAMAASLAAEEQRRTEAEGHPLEQRSCPELLAEFSASLMLPQLRQLPCGSRLLDPPLRSSVVELLQLERKSRQWYPAASTNAFFERLAGECCDAAAAAAAAAKAGVAASAPTAATLEQASGDAKSKANGKQSSRKRTRGEGSSSSGRGGGAQGRKSCRLNASTASPGMKLPHLQQHAQRGSEHEAGPGGCVAVGGSGAQHEREPLEATAAAAVLQEVVLQKVNDLKHTLYCMPSSSGQVPAIFQQQVHASRGGGSGSDSGGDSGEDAEGAVLDAQVLPRKRAPECIVLD